MKKYTIIFLAVALVAVFAATTMANEWNLYGSARMETFYKSTDLKDLGPDAAGRDTVKNTVWLFQNNSRVGATVKGDMLSARFEYGARPAVRDSGAVTNFANVRRLYGEWKFTEGWSLKVGKDYTPITFFLSGQVVNADAGLLQVGNAYGARKGQVALEGQLGPGKFKFATIDPSAPALTVIDPDPTDTITFAQTANENYIPKLEASYQMNFADGMSAHAFLGWQTAKVYLTQTDTSTVIPTITQFSKTTNSWVFGLGGEFNFGPMFIKPQASYYINGGNAGWLGGAIANAASFAGLAGTGVGTGQVALGQRTIDANALMAMLAIGFSPTEQLTLELGGGYLYNREKDDSNLKDQSYYELYLQAVYAMAPGVYLVPEIGYANFGDLKFKDTTPTADLGNSFYLGAKWQIDF